MGDLDDVWEVVLDYWTVTIFLPAVLLLLATLAFITRVMDKKEERR
ncbi:hypothetical protein ACU61A_17905 [Pseudonocardia sichuanensis]|uniref:Uncharacterized protein n=1 Tax=Pseudonocardia kunmingensis TaxID=630975 RepID=A0A543DRP5_9PSEU|nr:hypothetical protein [Pseudonocardia kunmingensis]TQM11995.1 hypothetical protein FB558_4570 [Pseudonocardia kunmingensis]